MTISVSVKVYFGLEYGGSNFATYDDPVKGVYDDATYLYASSDGDGVEIAGDSFYVTVRRGRNRELDEFQAGTATVSLRNFDRTYDALNTAGIYYGDLVPGKRVEITVLGRRIFTGVIEDWNLTWDVDGEAVAEFSAVDALGQLARIDFDAWTTTASQDAGARIGSILDRNEVAFPASRRDLDTGASVLKSDNVTWGSNVLNYAQLVNQSERGWFFASVYDLATFRARHALVGADISDTFADDGSGIPFHGISTDVGSELLFNRVGVDREGGTLQTVNDTASQDAYGIRALSLTGLLQDSDTQSLAMAEYLTYIYSEPTARVSSITVKVHDPRLTGPQQSAVAGKEIGELVDVVWTPRRIGSPIPQDALVVEGISHQVSSSGEYFVTLSTAPSAQSGVAIYDDAYWGVYEGPGVYSF